MNARVLRGVALVFLVFLLVQLGALGLVPTFYEQGYQTVENPSDPANSLLYIGAILVATALMLAAFRYDFDWAVRLVIVLTSGLLSWYVFAAVVPGSIPYAGALTVVLAALVAAALLVHPEWYVIDAAGVLMGAGAAGLFGISFGLLPAIVLLSALAVYDAISVYGTRHMLSLAEGVMDLRIPVVLVIPLTWSYSLIDDDFSGANEVHDGPVADGDGVDGPTAGGQSPVDDRPGVDWQTAHDDGSAADAGRPVADAERSTTDAGRPVADAERSATDAESTPDDSDAGVDGGADAPQATDRDAFFIGLGDAVMPTVMIASAAFFSAAPSLGVPGLPALNLPSLLAMVGTFAGLGVLLWAVLRGRAHAGLPLLNGGAIGGYLLGSVVAGVPLVEALGLAAYL